MNKNLFFNNTTQVANTTNRAGGKAYDLGAKHKLAQLACTGMFGNTFYASAQEQLSEVKQLLDEVDDYKFLAKLAVYARQVGYMKDMPALILAKLATTEKEAQAANEAFKAALPYVIDNSRMLLSYLQIVRSGQASGRKHMRNSCNRALQKLMKTMKDGFYFNATGGTLSMQDALRLIHPSPKDKQQNALWGYIMGKEYDSSLLPEYIRQYESFKIGKTNQVPRVNFQKLSALNLTKEHWTEIFKGMPWNATKKNLNTALRHGVLDSRSMVDLISERLKDKEQLEKMKVFPYEIYTAWKNIDSVIPTKIKNSLQDALEYSTRNIPSFGRNVVVGVDVSGSMSSSVGNRSSVSCIDVASLFASSILRKNEDAIIIPFDTRPHLNHNINSRDSIATNTKKLASYCGGGTNCSIPLDVILEKNIPVDTYIMVSDNESWASRSYWGNRGTSTMELWKRVKRRNPKAKMINIDIAPYSSSQTHEDKDILNIGGFSDKVFNVISTFLEGDGNWVEKIEKEIKIGLDK